MAEHKNASPRILSTGWGKMEVERLGKGKDFKLWPGGGRAWDWSESGTNHASGIQLEDVKELIAHKPKVIVLTRGVLARLKIPDNIKMYIEENDIEVIITSTKQGVRIYNDYVERKVPVGGLFHSTC